MSPITRDTYNIFSNLELDKLDNNICNSNNPKTGLFLDENPHLINSHLLSIMKMIGLLIFLLKIINI